MQDFAGAFVEFNIEFSEGGSGLDAGTVFSKNLSFNGDAAWTIRCYPRGGAPGQTAAGDGEHLAVQLVNLGSSRKASRLLFEAIALDRSDNKAAVPSPASLRFTCRCDLDYPNNGCQVTLPRVFRTSDLAAHCVVNGYVTVLCGLAVLQHNPIPIPPSRYALDLRKLEVRNRYGDPDVSFAMGDNNKLVPVHRKVLVARSPVFKAEFDGSMAESTMPVLRPPHEFQPSTFLAVLLYIYADRLPRKEEVVNDVPMVELLRDLLAAADWYAMDRLKLVCAKKLWEDVSVETVSKNLYYADRYNCRELRNACIHFMAAAENMRQVAVTDEYVWLAQNYPCLIEVLRSRIMAENI
ncbi:hypothetical protein EJB05_49379, partial [Eragrostis curvula]